MTITRGAATFIGCNFSKNNAKNGKTVGGAVYIRQDSIAFFIDTVFDGNTSTFGGAGIGARIHTKIYIHNSRFTNNRTNVSGHVQVAPGGGINAADSNIRISNTNFSGNQVAGHGAGLYLLGSKNDSWHSDGIVTNSLFQTNQAFGDSSFQAEGGGINVEDNSTLRVYNTRFISNTANIGGGINNYRAHLEVYNSSFLGNQASDPSDSASGFGGSISISSDDDNTSDSYAPLAGLVVEDTFFQGKYGSVVSAASTGGCIHTKGNEKGMGTNYGAAQNYRANVTLRRDVFYDCDVTSSRTVWGGGLEIILSNLLLEDSIIANSSVNNGDGGGLVVAVASSAEVNRSYFIGNSATGGGGAIYLFGAYLNLHDSFLAQNSAHTGANFWDFVGGAIFTNSDVGRGISASGTIQNNTFSQNVGMSIYDFDQGTPKSSVVYNGNKFYETTFSIRSNYWANGPAYHTGNLTSPDLNALVTYYGVDKAPLNNNTDGNSPYVSGTILAVPKMVLPSGANGETGPTRAYFGFAWSGASASYNGGGVSGYTGIASTTTAGTSTLSVNGVPYRATVSLGAAPAAGIGILDYGASYTLSWNVNAGTFLDAAFDKNLSIPSAPSGSISASAMPGTTFHFYAITKEGGVVVSGTAVPYGSLTNHIYLPKITH